MPLWMDGIDYWAFLHGCKIIHASCRLLHFYMWDPIMEWMTLIDVLRGKRIHMATVNPLNLHRPL